MGFGSTIHNIRETVKYLKKSPSCLFKFGKIARQLVISTAKELCFNVPTCWNFTYQMLEHAIPFKLAFEEYAARDANYAWLPSYLDWAKAEKISKFLLVFIMCQSYSQAPHILHRICILLKFGL